jgi:glyoxylase-like metal-dependent hydrolase (beta-lactamase superfamily II)
MGATKSESLYVRQLTLGPMKNFIHLFGPADSPHTAVVDPAWDVEAIRAAADEDGRRLVSIVVTHGHQDHVNGVTALLERLDLPVYAQGPEVRSSAVLQGLGHAVRELVPGDELRVGAATVTCVHTPGHTPGSQCLLCRGALFSGDTLFVNACGRCDLPGGDVRAMHASLFDTLGRLPDDTVLYPGHHYGDVPVSSLGRERANNPYLKLADAGAFESYRMRPR